MNPTARQKPHVLLLVENNPYPQDFRVRREATALCANGYDVSVVAPRDRGQPWTEVVSGVRVHRFAGAPAGRGLWGYALEFAWATFAIGFVALRVALRRRVDVVHAANPPDTLFIVGAMLKLVGARFIFDHHDLSPEIYQSRGGREPNRWALACLFTIERWTFAVADTVISTNESYRAIAMDRGRKSAEKVFVVRNGPPLDYCPLQVDPDLARRATFLLGYVGTIGPQDGLDYLVRSMQELVRTLDRRDVLAVVVGDGDALPGVRELVRALELQAYFLFTGRLAEHEVRQVLSSVHVCVQPDPSNPLNDKSTMNKMMEYMALAKPTVAFDLVETRFSAGGAALYAPSNDVHAFAMRVNWLLERPEERARMGRLGQDRIRSRLAWEHSVPALLETYRQVLGLDARDPESCAPTVEND